MGYKPSLKKLHGIIPSFQYVFCTATNFQKYSHCIFHTKLLLENLILPDLRIFNLTSIKLYKKRRTLLKRAEQKPYREFGMRPSKVVC